MSPYGNTQPTTVNGLKHPATIIALLALFSALGGGAALASGLISGRQIANHSIPEWKLTPRAVRNLQGGPRATGPQGPAGPRGPRGPSAANALARASGLVAWTSDPALLSTSIVDSSGSIHGGSVWLTKGNKISWLAELIVARGSRMTHGAFAIYDANLHLVARTSDKPSAFQTAPADSWVKLPLTRPYTATASGRYYFVDLLAGATVPRIAIAARSAAVLPGANVLPTGVPRAVGGGPGLSAFPSTLANKGSGLTRCILAS